jgi:PAS domain-containing protein
MLELGLADWGLIVGVAVLTAGLGVYWLAPRNFRPVASPLSGIGARDRVFLFDGPDLIDISSGGQDFLNTDLANFNWSRLRDALVGTFPDFPKSPKDVQSRGNLTVPAQDRKVQGDLVCEWIDGITRVLLPAPERPETRPQTVSKELETLRMAMGQAPYPVWHIGQDCKLDWGNGAYDDLRRKVGTNKPDDCGPMFPSISAKDAIGRKTRASVLTENGGKKLWFDVTVVPQETGYLCYAVDINAVVDAEIAQRNFVQTLAKTFAQLSIGLAIFDRNRQLALFNPALIDLTALPADFLSARPNLLSFFDRLRDHRMMPEPKNYGSWRHQMADLVAAAADGRYQETWTLPSGAVYSVSGRPHPDGAVAFLFEDITAEITLTRRFRTDLEISQSMLDQMEDAIVVFAENGALCSSNQAYRKLWNVDPEASFVQMAILDAARTWQGQCHASPVLGEVREFVETQENRAAWWGKIRLKSGLDLCCGVYPVSHGATMVVFSRNIPGDPPNGAALPEPRIVDITDA